MSRESFKSHLSPLISPSHRQRYCSISSANAMSTLLVSLIRGHLRGRCDATILAPPDNILLAHASAQRKRRPKAPAVLDTRVSLPELGYTITWDGVNVQNLLSNKVTLPPNHLCLRRRRAGKRSRVYILFTSCLICQKNPLYSTSSPPWYQF